MLTAWLLQLAGVCWWQLTTNAIAACMQALNKLTHTWHSYMHKHTFVALCPRQLAWQQWWAKRKFIIFGISIEPQQSNRLSLCFISYKRENYHWHMQISSSVVNASWRVEMHTHIHVSGNSFLAATPSLVVQIFVCIYVCVCVLNNTLESILAKIYLQQCLYLRACGNTIALCLLVQTCQSANHKHTREWSEIYLLVGACYVINFKDKYFLCISMMQYIMWASPRRKGYSCIINIIWKHFSNILHLNRCFEILYN